MATVLTILLSARLPPTWAAQVGGVAYVIFGKTGALRSAIDLTNLSASDRFIIVGDAANDHLGRSVSGAGDINGDGIDDLIVGAPLGDNGGLSAGEAYVIFGKAGATRGTIDLTTLTASDGFIIQGDAAGDRAGRRVSSAGDINGDGFDDFLIGAIYASPNSNGRTYVIFGKEGETRANIDLSSLSATDGFFIQGAYGYDQFGISVSAAGDVNGDGIDDLIIGAPRNDIYGSPYAAGATYVIYGKSGPTRADIQVNPFALGDGFAILGDATNDAAGYSVSSAGDVNGDGIGDLIVGAYTGDNGGSNAGEAYVIFGKEGTSRALIDLTNLSASDGFIIIGDVAGDLLGNSVSGGGDVNGNGYDDLIIGAPFGDDGGDRCGEVYVIFGRAGSVRANIDLSNLAQGDGLIIVGDLTMDTFGYSVSTAGDVNGDGLADILVGAPLADDHGALSGKAFIIYGSTAFGPVTPIIGTAVGETLNGAAGNDTIDGLGGNDILLGGGRDDKLTGGDGADTLDGGSGSDQMIGGAGNDSYIVDTVSDVVIEDAENGVDSVAASISYTLGANVEQLILTGSGNINGSGNGLANQITGNAGNNRIEGGAGDDALAGGLGNDIYVVDSSGDVVTEAASADIDLVEASASFVLGDNLENLTLTGAASINGTGNAIGNRIIGTSGNNSLDGAAGADTMQALGGNDSYIVDSASDRVVETLSLTVGDTNDAGGIDTVFASVSYSIDSASNVRFVENLTLTGAANINAIGNALANVLTGNAGNNTLDGGAGVDVLAGGGGNDLYLLDGASETVTEAAAAGADTVRIAASYTLTANVENLQLQGSANINGIGNAGNNSLTGTSGLNRLEGLGRNDIIDGGAGADTMIGGSGDDLYFIDNGSDRVFETVTNNANDTNDAGGIVAVSTSITINMASYNGIRFVERAILTGTGSIGITGNALDNYITGNNGNNQLDGGEGADTLLGGRGNDIYIVDNLGDSISEAGGDGIDVVRSSVSWTLGTGFETLELSGTGSIDGTGNGLANRLTGTATVTDTNDAGGIDQIFSSFAVNLNQSNGMRFIENVTLTGTAAAAVYGNDLGNAITANSGANFLDGANGNDVILGMAGNDTMLGGVDKFEPVSGGGDLDHAEEAFGELVVSGCDGAVDFQATEEAFDVVALFVEGAVMFDLDPAV
jgi:Ca2+-binding RTX toxin-like protein